MSWQEGEWAGFTPGSVAWSGAGGGGKNMGIYCIFVVLGHVNISGHWRP